MPESAAKTNPAYAVRVDFWESAPCFGLTAPARVPGRSAVRSVFHFLPHWSEWLFRCTRSNKTTNGLPLSSAGPRLPETGIVRVVATAVRPAHDSSQPAEE